MDEEKIRVTVRFFAVAREMLGQEALSLTLPVGATLADLEARLHREYPVLRTLRTRLAVNLRYVESSYVLQPEDEVACIPPVGGG